MTDRVNALLVVLDDDIREDDCQATMNAIKQLRGVLSVQPNVARPADTIARQRARRELADKLWAVLEKD